MAPPIKIIFAEDHLLFRQSLIPLLKHFNIETIAEAENGLQLLEILKTKTPDLILLDYEMPLMNGDKAMERILELYPGMKIIFITMYDIAVLKEYLYSKGACGFLTKNTDIEQVAEIIRSVHEKESKSNSRQKRRKKPELKVNFSKKQEGIIPLIRLGRSNLEIAEKLKISEKTVQWHKNNLFAKTGTNNAGEFVNYLSENKFYFL